MLRQFLREFRIGDDNFVYRDQLNANYDQKHYFVEVDLKDVTTFSPKMGQLLRQRPLQVLPLFERAAQDVIAMSRSGSNDQGDGSSGTSKRREDITRMQVQLVNLDRLATSIRELDSGDISQLLKIPGIVIAATKPTCKATKLTVMCSNCRTSMTFHSNGGGGGGGFGQVSLPRKCANANDEKNERPCPLDPFVVLPDKCDYLDVQTLKLQENPEDIPTGEMPRHIVLFCDRQLVNKVKPGARVNIIGVYKVMDTYTKGNSNGGSANGKDATVCRPYVEVIGIEERAVIGGGGGGGGRGDSDGSGSSSSSSGDRGNATFGNNGNAGHATLFSTDEEEAIRELIVQSSSSSSSSYGHVSDCIAQSIAPAIWGNLDVKKALACLLFGGSRKILPDGMKLRGDINVLLLGDPSVAKSQLLKFVKDVAPIGVYTSGKGSSASGLTASVIKEGGEFHLEGGAMVLADGGVVCIDEFDKMREQDRVAIHEAMEQQTISIAKAGITTILNSRTAVLAAANPVLGRYDDLKTTAENIEFETTILSRFDLIFIIRDVKDKERDMRLAQHIMDLHISTTDVGDRSITNATTTVMSPPISPSMLVKYISYAKRIHPRLNNAAVEMLRTHYVQFRQEAKQREIETGEPSAIPLTVRQLESLVRIAESLARMELVHEVNEEHVKEAVRLFKVSTLRAAKSGIFDDTSSQSGDFQQGVQKAERSIRRRVAIGCTISVKKLMDEMIKHLLPQRAIARALDNLHARGEIEFKSRKLKIFRKK
ncbi:hypothetical protein RFI_03741 [Reticulomyxa filosa]|uniref:DNA replication licensing factor MCM5 n=1 Tax=Reticulomyxa filosa TaxID=46433 RepID=X6P5D0_RETFI|nr:hypothetical protein RFI_03741 [Reticulomyxa filosa]|eukprot:ETO33366.1 hypothetical protein RFI_03741 [Reticulomyxa filosa]